MYVCMCVYVKGILEFIPGWGAVDREIEAVFEVRPLSASVRHQLVQLVDLRGNLSKFLVHGTGKLGA